MDSNSFTLGPVERMILNFLAAEGRFSDSCIENALGLSHSEISVSLDFLIRVGLAEKIHFCGMTTWTTTKEGRKHQEALASLKAAPGSEEPFEDDAPSAVICLDADELDAWWQSLDVEQKADAFAQFSLAMYQGCSHIYIEPRENTIPFAGVVGSPQTEAHDGKQQYAAERAGCADPDGYCGDISDAEAR